MNPDRPARAPAADLKCLETRIDDLIELCARLQQENRALQDRTLSLANERDELLRKNDQARAYLEETVARLKTLEQPG